MGQLWEGTCSLTQPSPLIIANQPSDLHPNMKVIFFCNEYENGLEGKWTPLSPHQPHITHDLRACLTNPRDS